MLNHLDCLEFYKIKESLLSYALTDRGKEMVEKLEPFSEVNLLKDALDELEEAYAFFIKYKRPPLSYSLNLDPLLDVVKKGGSLTINEFDRILNDIKMVKKIVDFMKEKVETFPLLKTYIDSFSDLGKLEDKISKIISTCLTIYDDASPILGKIRQRIKSSENKIKKTTERLMETYQDLTTGSNITLRDGHYVLPIKVSDKYNVPGIIHDISASGQTVFIEPSEIVALNNELLSLFNEERMEIARLLALLSREVAKEEVPLRINNIKIGELDFLFAKASYGEHIDGYVASISNKQEISLINARHPLIEPHKVVANTFEFSEDMRLIIISGPNAGGKTVVLKTIGLLVLMNQMGLMLPVSKKPILGFFNNIYADIGDAQSLSDNLSTFSGHMQKVSFILDNATPKDLILLDELGTGTDPKEGEALAFSVCHHLLKIGVLSVVSSHYSALKTFASSNKGAVNASMLFDEKALVPLYKFRQGLPGKSYGLVVAERYGIKKELIDYAKESILGQKHLSVDELLSELSNQISENEKLKDVLKVQENKLNLELRKQAKLNEELTNVKNTISSQVQEKVAERIEEVEQELSLLIKKAHEDNLKPHEIIALREKAGALQEEKVVETPPFSGQIGDYATVKGLGISGEVIEIKGQNIRIRTEGGRIINAKLNHLLAVEKDDVVRKKPKTSPVILTPKLEQSVPQEINLIGQRVEEALANLRSYLDKALLKHYKSVRIIHGFGSGALRSAVHNYLKTLSFVDNYHLAGPTDGGGGATIVNFK
ncbi:MAG TPA: Smr/MutS family protein [Bacilli bacterium]|nr:Smr/MutS family protein [Bacilli bacterium]